MATITPTKVRGETKTTVIETGIVRKLTVVHYGGYAHLTVEGLEFDSDKKVETALPGEALTALIAALQGEVAEAPYTYAFEEGDLLRLTDRESGLEEYVGALARARESVSTNDGYELIDVEFIDSRGYADGGYCILRFDKVNEADLTTGDAIALAKGAPA